MSQIDQEMWQDFVVEAEENLQEIEPNLLLIEQESDNTSLLNDCFRNMHSIKGAANYMGLKKIASLSHRIETLFDRIRDNKISVDHNVMDVIFAGTDRIKQLTTEVANHQQEKSEISDIMEKLNKIIYSEPSPPPSPAPKEQDQDDEVPDSTVSETINEEDPELLSIYREEMTSLYEHLVQTAMHKDISYPIVHDIITNMSRVTNYVAKDSLLEKLNSIQEMLTEKEKQDIPAPEASSMILDRIKEVLIEDMGPNFKPNIFNEPDTSTKIEEDKELYNIFLDFVRETAWPLANIPNTPDKTWISNCQEAVEKLTNSANYMDYTEITQLLEEWQETMVEQLTNETISPEPLKLLWVKFIDMLPGIQIDDPAFTKEPEQENLQEVNVQPEDETEIIDKQTEDARDNEHLKLEAAGALPEQELTSLAGADVLSSTPPENQKDQELFSITKSDVSKAKSLKSSKSSEQTVRVDLEKIEGLLGEVGELVILRSALMRSAEQIKSIYGFWMEKRMIQSKDIKPFKETMLNLTEQTSLLERVTRQLQDGVMRMRMFPVENLFNRFPRMVRDLSRKLDKDIELLIEGADTDLDKRVMEKMVDPMQHIIRNAITHGIEPPDERKKLGKTSNGTIRLVAGQEGNSVIISIIDDGKGLDRKAISDKAVKNGLISEEETTRLTDENVWNMIFLPGISTAKQVSDDAGRGVGMDVVKKNVENIGGAVTIKSSTGKGTAINIKIPLTLAIIQALLVQTGNQKMAVPLSVVLETFRVFSKDISSVDGHEIISVRQNTVPLIRLGKVFQGTGSDIDAEKLFVVRIQQGNMEFCLGVDSLLGQQEIVIKPLAEYLTDQPGFSGATVLGDGSIALIIDVAAMVERARSFTMKKQQIMRDQAMAGENRTIN